MPQITNVTKKNLMQKKNVTKSKANTNKHRKSNRTNKNKQTTMKSIFWLETDRFIKTIY